MLNVSAWVSDFARGRISHGKGKSTCGGLTGNKVVESTVCGICVRAVSIQVQRTVCAGNVAPNFDTDPFTVLIVNVLSPSGSVGLERVTILPLDTTVPASGFGVSETSG